MYREAHALMGAALLCGVFAFTASAAADTGKDLFERHCALCHGIGGTGGRGPALTRPKLSRASNNAGLRKIIQEGIDPEMPGLWFLDDEAADLIAAYVTDLGKLPAEKPAGDPVKGEAVYKTQACAGCHTLGGSGTPYGPDLSDIGARRSAAHLQQALLKPDATLPEGFLMLQVRKADGSAIEGVRVAETNFTIYVRDIRGQIHSFPTSGLSIERLPGKTPMPAYASLSMTERDDLVAFLSSKRGNQ